MIDAKQRALIEKYIEVEPHKIALKTGDRELSQMVAMLQKSKEKLPSFYEARCYIMPISYQQATSEIIAKSRFAQTGEIAIDLTCGLGVDTIYLAKKYKKVIAVEMDSQKVKIAKYNFKLLGVENVEVVCDSAENFLHMINIEHIDLIFCDPSRRSYTGEKQHALEDCSPNIIELMPLLQKKTKQIMIKLSPLFDVKELFRIFEESKRYDNMKQNKVRKNNEKIKNNINVEVISYKNECKEVVLHLFGTALSNNCLNKINKLINTIVSKDKIIRKKYEYPVQEKRISQNSATRTDVLNSNMGDGELKKREIDIFQAKYIYRPDVTFYKSRTVRALMMEPQYAQFSYCYNSYVFTQNILPDFLGKAWQIEFLAPYKTKELRVELKKRKIKKITILKREFLFSSENIFKQLKLLEGESCYDLICFMIDKKPYVALANRLEV